MYVHYTLYTHTHTQRERELFVSPGQRLILPLLSILSPPQSIGRQEHTEDASHNHWHYDILLCYVVLHMYSASLKGRGRNIDYNIISVAMVSGAINDTVVMI